MADASDSKSDAGNSVWVQVPSPALVIPQIPLFYKGFEVFSFPKTIDHYVRFYKKTSSDFFSDLLPRK